jgi:hypothetical protein
VLLNYRADPISSFVALFAPPGQKEPHKEEEYHAAAG